MKTAAFEAIHDDFVLDFGFPESRMTFKLMASTANFSAKELKHDALPPPVKFRNTTTHITRALKRRSAPKADDWTTTTVHIVLKNPDGK